jgi:hypothetical protein
VPVEIRRTPPFDVQVAVTGAFLPVYRRANRWSALAAVLDRTAHEVPVLWLLGSDPIEQAIVDRIESSDPAVAYARAVGLVARRDAEALAALRALAADPTAVPVLLFVACREGELGSVRDVAVAYREQQPDRELVEWLDRRCP